MQLSSLRETLSLNQYEVASFYFHTLVCFDVWYIQQLLNVLLLSQQTLNLLCEAREEVANLIYPNGANFHDAILGNVKSRKSYQVFF